MSSDNALNNLELLVKELACKVKTQQDLSDLTSHLVKLTVEAALGVEMEAHLGYAKHEARGRNTGNSRNGSTPKTLKGEHGEVMIHTPRDRAGTFEPQLVQKGQTRLTNMDDQILCLYAKGLSTREIVQTFEEMYGAEVSPHADFQRHRGGDRTRQRVAESYTGRGVSDCVSGWDCH